MITRGVSSLDVLVLVNLEYLGQMFWINIIKCVGEFR